MTDYYRDRVRHGGILANNFVKFWWENQVGPMQYGTEEKKPRRFGPGVMGPPVGESQRLQLSITRGRLVQLIHRDFPPSRPGLLGRHHP